MNYRLLRVFIPGFKSAFFTNHHQDKRLPFRKIGEHRQHLALQQF